MLEEQEEQRRQGNDPGESFRVEWLLVVVDRTFLIKLTTIIIATTTTQSLSSMVVEWNEKKSSAYSFSAFNVTN